MYSTHDETSVRAFLTKDNAQMIWDLLQETDIYNNIEYQDKIEIRQQFISKMRQFYEKNDFGASGLMDVNKRFIGNILNEYKSIKPQLHIQTKQELYTAKDIQSDRQQKFENDLNRRRQDFDNAVTVVKPVVPDFSDKKDTPISEMDSLIAQTIARRNFEIEQIHRELSPNNKLTPPQETSVKTEKLVNNDHNLKQIIIEKEEMGRVYEINDVINLYQPEKRVTVNENNNKTYVYDNSLPNKENFMSKFKKVDQSVNQKEEIGITGATVIQPNDSTNPDNIDYKINKLNEKLDHIVQLIYKIESKIANI